MTSTPAGSTPRDGCSSPQPNVALSIAGSDSSGGAGIQADLGTFASFGVFGTCALTAITAQSSLAGVEVTTLDAAVVDGQIAAVLGDFAPGAVKTGMLGTLAVVTAVARRAAAGELPNLVVDPVFESSTGGVLLESEGIGAIGDLLLPFATVVTPNLAELAVLTDTDPRCLTDLGNIEKAARTLSERGARWVVATGGHLLGGNSPDVVTDGSSTWVLSAERIVTSNTHGTGCTLSAAITAGLANGREPLSAIEHAKDYVTRALAAASSWRLGPESGPLDHSANCRS